MTETEAFKNIMRGSEVEPPAEIIADGTLHRFHVAGDRSDSKNGWYILHLDEPAAGQFGCWKRGISETWCSKAYNTLTREEKTHYTAKMEAMRRQREEERERIQTDCRAWCAEALEKAKDATNENPYLKRKGVNAYGLKAFKDSLMVPLMDTAGTIHGMQFISPDGSKKFKTGTNKVGHFFSIGKKGAAVVICEGYATGASIHEATGMQVLVAFDAGNLQAVARMVREKRPDHKIIIAADDDHATEGNPGLTKAREAAKAVNGFLAVPVFQDSTTRGTDFNDLHQAEGLEAVRRCIEVAQAPVSSECELQAETSQQAVARLASIDPLEYDRIRKSEAKKMGVRPATLDAAVKGVRKTADTVDLPFDTVEPYSEPIDPARLLSDIAATIRRFIVCPKEVSHAVALWVAMSWFIDVVDVAPLALITAPEKRCGKSQLLFLLGRLSARAITASSISPAALFRTIDAWSPTLLIDEADAFMRDNEELRGLLNSGHTRDSAYVIRTVGENFTPTKFNTWGAKALAGIGHLADTLMDRSIILELRRKLPHESVERIRHAEPWLFNDLRSRLARFADDYSDQVRQARPPLPESLNDRAQDNWEPLLAIAMTASEEWLHTGTVAALKLSGSDSAAQTVGTELLLDIKEIFEEKRVDRITTAELIRALCADDEKLWATYNRGLPIKPRQLASKLKGYGILSKTIRIGYDTAKGYEIAQFQESFLRYLPSPPSPSVTTSQMATSADLNVTDNPSRYSCVTDGEVCKPATRAVCDGVTDRGPLPETTNLEKEIPYFDLEEVAV